MEPRHIRDALSMAAFQAFLELHAFCRSHPGLSALDAIDRLTRLRASASGLDFRGGLALYQHLDSARDWPESYDRLRLFIFDWVRIVKPAWLSAVPYGRDSVKNALGTDAAQCLREGGLFDDEPDDESIEWWDRMAAVARGSSDAEKMKRARHAERLSLEHERERLASLKIARQPRWVSLDDNRLGYDIVSYDRDSLNRVINRLVEVKSRFGSSIFLTRNEWDNAFKARQRAVIHIWDLPEEKLHEYRVPHLEPNIPRDRGMGAWQNVQIKLDRSHDTNLP